ncbi:germination protein YpeB [Bacillus sp. ISL-40]|uniref:germination protein YpeB n=1 Tax=unclassified Bacillus (in: firmicutes) TaxID=185979 RepID=UPI001BE86B03|nr:MULTISPECIES: germination protein YpeB [unclassified Bacillus (in: firmicutes)]MBT2698918.1 germination protein YpeB [Bacillus sp. ISL-40]MBT2721633.1 germination protein YpeB [Bacillus sp. ISL-46]MBT2744570.1 germination protein YpeB [Bacillus sp. ISL-77]
MIRGILIGVLAVGVAGTAYWGYQEHQEKNAILINAENAYQRAFHDLSYQVDLLHDKIGTTLAMNSRQSLSPSLIEVWRITSEAHSDVGQLPLTLLPFNKTEEFLAKIGNFSYRTAVRDLDKEPLSKDEYNTLKVLYKQSGDIQDDLRKVQHMVLKNNLRWMDVELALASGKESTDNTIIDGFKSVEKTVTGYVETDLGPTFVNMQKKDENFKKIKGKTISKQEAIKIAKKYMKIDRNSEVKVTENGKGSNYGFYSVSIRNKKTGDEGSMDITKKAGHPIWFINHRDVKKQVLSLNDADNKAATFLKETGFKDLEIFESTQYDNIGVFNFVSKINGIRIYPESIKVKVALDNGDIIGVSAEEYLKSFQTRKIEKPAISLEQARAKVNPNFKVMEDRQAIIINDLNEEVLCYEFLGTIDDDTYRIFINAKSGVEEDVEKMKNAETVYEDVI